MGGPLVFNGTRVSVRSLLDHLSAGESIEDFLEGFPSVRREQVLAYLPLARPGTCISSTKRRPLPHQGRHAAP